MVDDLLVDGIGLMVEDWEIDWRGGGCCFAGKICGKTLNVAWGWGEIGIKGKKFGSRQNL